MRNFLLPITMVVLLLGLSGCGGGSSTSISSNTGGGTGTLNVQLTDTPACGYDHVFITVDHIEISADGSQWTSIPVSAGVGRIDLLSLTNGTLEPLAQAPLAAGTYQQVRLVLKANGNAAPWANSLVLTSDSTKTEIPLTTPSAQQSGYKIVGPFTVEAGAQADLVLDFNACKSVVVAGNSGKYLLKPVVTPIAQSASGSISGTTRAGSQVYAEQDGQIVTGTVADSATGNFKLFPIQLRSGNGSGGQVDVVVVPPPPSSGTDGYGAAIIQDVPVGTETSVGTITLQPSTINTVSGIVTVGGSAGAANLVASQEVTLNNRTYEIGPTSTTTGSYSMPLAATGPWVGVYSSTLPVSLAAEATYVGKYNVTATDASGTSQTLPVDVSAGSVATADFSLSP